MANTYTATVTGQRISANPADFTPEAIREEDYLVALSHQCRFNGHVPEFYSVLTHSLFVSVLAQLAGEPAYIQRACLMHDVHEAYVGDIASPQKDWIEGWHDYELRMQDMVAFAVKVPAPGSSFPTDDTVRTYDLQALAIENTYLRGRDDIEAPLPVTDSMVQAMHRLRSLTVMESRELFAARDRVLFHNRLIEAFENRA